MKNVSTDTFRAAKFIEDHFWVLGIFTEKMKWEKRK
jgi:hypothetical protein